MLCPNCLHEVDDDRQFGLAILFCEECRTLFGVEVSGSHISILSQVKVERGGPAVVVPFSRKGALTGLQGSRDR